MPSVTDRLLIMLIMLIILLQHRVFLLRQLCTFDNGIVYMAGVNIFLFVN